MGTVETCLFCRIIAGVIPADPVYDDELVVAFKDINPQAPTHTLICPRKHIPSLNELTRDDELLMGHLVQVSSELATRSGIDRDGYRLVANCMEGAGQSVFHIHFHLLGGRTFNWPPG